MIPEENIYMYVYMLEEQLPTDKTFINQSMEMQESICSLLAVAQLR